MPYQLKCIEGDVIEISESAANLSITIKDMIEDLGETKSQLPIKIKKSTLLKIVTWMEHQHAIYKDYSSSEEERENHIKNPNEYDLKYFEDLSDDDIVEIILACNNLDIKSLLDVACDRVASLVRGESPEEIRKVLERTDKPIPDDLSEGIPGYTKKNDHEVVKGEAYSGSQAEKRKR